MQHVIGELGIVDTLTPVCSSYCATSFFTFSRCESDRLDDQTSSVVLPSALLPPLEDEPPHAASESAMLAVQHACQSSFPHFSHFSYSFSVFVLLSLPLYFSAAYSAPSLCVAVQQATAFLFSGLLTVISVFAVLAQIMLVQQLLLHRLHGIVGNQQVPAMPSAHIPPSTTAFSTAFFGVVAPQVNGHGCER